uniref:BHLH domain-containing protein n=1 Tax=Fagus sylvatica TaxID=28930 RepID=A0A2N9FJZ2_FAGSY
MSQCVPSWDFDDNPNPVARPSLRSNSNSTAPDVQPMLDYEVAELTWENGQPAMHGLGTPRVPVKPIPSTTSATKFNAWEKPRASGTLESMIWSHGLTTTGQPWLPPPQPPATMTMDALVPCSNRTDDQTTTQGGGLGGTCVVGCSNRAGSCSGPATQDQDEGRRAREARVSLQAAAPEWSSRDQSVSGSATCGGRDSQHVTTVDTCERDLGVGFTSTASLGSPDSTSSGKPFTKATTTEDHDSREARDVEDKKKGTGKSSVSNKRSRAAAIHNQSERADKASMLDEVIEYLKQLQAQVHMMSRMTIPPMMLPMAMQQQLQMSMMAPMGMGMGMGMGLGMGMDMNNINRSNIPGIPPVLHPTAFMPMTSWDGSGDRMQATSAAVMPDPFSTFLACQSQPMTMDAYSRMAAMYQQLHQPPPSSSKS